jgi:signal transduction histidine kinase/DNA-binding response OmpR family regulator/CHASE3 domain sensor protein
MNFTIVSRIIGAFAVALLSLLIIGSVSYRNLQSLNGDADLVVHTQEVLGIKERMSSAFADAQGAGRAFVLTGESRFRDDAAAGSAETRRLLRQLREETLDNASQQMRIDELEPFLEQRLQLIAELVQKRSEVATTFDARLLDLVNRGATLASDIGTRTKAIEEEELRLLNQRRQAARQTERLTTATLLYGSGLAVLVVALIGWWLLNSILSQLCALSTGAARVAEGDYQHVLVTSSDEIGQVAVAFNVMAESVRVREVVLSDENWLKDVLSRFSRLFEAERDLAALCTRVLSELATLLDARHGALYAREQQGDAHLVLRGVYAADGLPQRIEPGQSLVGQVLRERRRLLLSDVPEDYVRISSSLGTTRARHILVFPAVLVGEVLAVVELAGMRAFTERELTFIDQFGDGLALVLNTVMANALTRSLLDQARQLSATLAVQRQQLEERNDELETQSQRLQASEEQLEQQQEELKQTNEELEQTNEELHQANKEMEERAQQLAEQKLMLEQSNVQIEQARYDLELQSKQLALTSKYKSEFLANMSHELRTPLNSLLILSKLLADNVDGTLSTKQVQHANTIYGSGTDLLRLIDDILDMSKIEAGAVELEIEDVGFDTLEEFVESLFHPIAQHQGVELRVHVDPQLPKSLRTDGRRLQQILKNLLANAFKFTKRGSVELSIQAQQSATELLVDADAATQLIAFAVKDTGIGIPAERQQIIFEAFQQAEAGTARKYGGTGLGLSISRELTTLLGGTLKVESTPDEGSTFTLTLPRTLQAAPPGAHPVQVRTAPRPTASAAAPALSASSTAASDQALEPDLIADDRANLAPNDLVLLVIEDDRHFAAVLAQFARDKGFKVVVSGNASAGIALARRLKPAAITLDLHLPDSDGRVVLDLLKHDASTRHIPVHVISVEDERARSLLHQGAVSFLRKPVTREALEEALSNAMEFAHLAVRQLLVVEDDPQQRSSIVELIGNSDVHTTAVATAQEALLALETTRFDCLVVDLILPDQNGSEFIKEVQRRHGGRAPPVVVYTGKDLSRREESELRALSEAIIIKNARSPERLLDETALFLHRVQAKLPAATQRLIERVQREDAQLSGRKVLVVDDDLRNIFAISTALENYKMVVAYAESGQEALDKLASDTEIEAVLMDVMMPEMDGFEAIRRIRIMDGYQRVPIIMVTAKAMRGDREKCIAAGASDYITKPVDMDQLRSLLRVWLYRAHESKERRRQVPL